MLAVVLVTSLAKRACQHTWIQFKHTHRVLHMLRLCAVIMVVLVHVDCRQGAINPMHQLIM